MRLTIIDKDENVHHLEVPAGANLRVELLKAGFTPYVALTSRLNCGGRGLCATCGVWIDDGEPPPIHWHDKLAKAYAYPRLSCQITVEAPMTVRILPKKRIWGHRDPARRNSSQGKH